MLDDREGPSHILVVCLGNVCRSPAAEVLLKRALGPQAPVVVRSAGTRAPEGRPVHPLTADALGRREIAVEHAAQRLTQADLDDVDLVLAADRSIRSEVVRLRPASLATVFTLTEFARLIAQLDETPRSLPELVRDARGQRGLGGVVDHAVDDVVDPIGRGARQHERAVARIEAATRSIAAVLSRGWDG